MAWVIFFWTLSEFLVVARVSWWCILLFCVRLCASFSLFTFLLLLWGKVFFSFPLLFLINMLVELERFYIVITSLYRLCVVVVVNCYGALFQFFFQGMMKIINVNWLDIQIFFSLMLILGHFHQKKTEPNKCRCYMLINSFWS